MTEAPELFDEERVNEIADLFAKYDFQAGSWDIPQERLYLLVLTAVQTHNRLVKRPVRKLTSGEIQLAMLEAERSSQRRAGDKFWAEAFANLVIEISRL